MRRKELERAPLKRRCERGRSQRRIPTSGWSYRGRPTDQAAGAINSSRIPRGLLHIMCRVGPPMSGSGANSMPTSLASSNREWSFSHSPASTVSAGSGTNKSRESRAAQVASSGAQDDRFGPAASVRALLCCQAAEFCLPDLSTLRPRRVARTARPRSKPVMPRPSPEPNPDPPTPQPPQPVPPPPKPLPPPPPILAVDFSPVEDARRLHIKSV